MAKAIFKTATFRPAEIENITGITPDSLRDMRKRGYVEETEGWTAASLVQTAQLILVSRLWPKMQLAAAWEIARYEDAARQVVAFALEFGDAVGKAAQVGLSGKRRRFLCISDLKPLKAFFTNDAKKIYYTQAEVPLLTLDLKAYGVLLFDKAGKPLIQIEEDD
jgi:hypothetical protein